MLLQVLKMVCRIARIAAVSIEDAFMTHVAAIKFPDV